VAQQSDRLTPKEAATILMLANAYYLMETAGSWEEFWNDEELALFSRLEAIRDA
jgi:hypothetical protein